MVVSDHRGMYEKSKKPLMTGVRKLSDRRSNRCLDYGIKGLKHYQNSKFFPLNQNDESHMNIRDRQPYDVNFAKISQYNNSAIPYGG